MVGCLLAITASACAGSGAGDLADTIFFGDGIVTMDPALPTVEAVAVRGETIVAAAALDDVMALRGESTRVVDLAGRALLPGFIDAHGHFLATGRRVGTLTLHAPPVGDVRTVEDIVRKIRAWIEDHDVPPGQTVTGSGYDDSLLEEGRHPTAADLDRASTRHPIVISHVSGHLWVANSAALAAGDVTASTPDPAGGLIRRKPGSREPDGVLEETAGGLVADRGGSDAEWDVGQSARRSIELYSSYGTTTVQNGGATSPERVRQLRDAAAREPFQADVAVFASAGSILDGTLQYEEDYTNGMRVAGVKFVLDGSPQGRTAWTTRPYAEGPAGAPADYTAYGRMAPGEYAGPARELVARGVPYLAHANGDAAIDQMLDGVEEAVAGTDPMPDHRSVIVHAQLMRADQLDRATRLGVVPSFFSAHAFFWGDWHVRSFGEERGSNISPVRWAIERGVPFTVHNDSPVVPPDMMRLVSITVNRKTRSGRVLGPHQRATVMEALRAVTLGAAYQYFEEERKGSITVGKQADLVVLGENPLSADPETLAEIPILETFSRGRSVYTR